MNILVTGGCGKVGHGVVDWLVRAGHQVRVVDLRVQHAVEGAEYAECDITNFDAIRAQARGQEAIIHLAAYAYPAAAPGAELFRVNCAGTFNIFEAASVEGIHRVAVASSINALGYNFGVKSFPIRYFPIDEAHPTFTTDPYSFSKETVESIARYYWRRDGIASACLRMPFIYTKHDMEMPWSKMYLEGIRSATASLLSAAEPEQRERVSAMKTGLEQGRALRMNEKPFDINADWSQQMDFNSPEMLAFLGYTDFWSVLSVEDAAQAFEKSLLANLEGSHAFYLSERENSTGTDSETLLHLFYPEVTARKELIIGAQNLVSYNLARDMLGFEPKHLLRERF